MAPRTASTLLALAVSLVLVRAQIPTPGQSDPTAVCPYALSDQIQACRNQVYTVEAALPQGPCWSSDWACICNVQQGLLDCYAPCPGSTPQTDIDYNNANCAGQNGVSNAAANGGPQYSGGILTTTGGGILSTTAATISTSLTSSSPAAVTTITTSSSSSPTADSTVVVSTGVTTTIPPQTQTGENGRIIDPVSDPKDQPTPVQSRSANVFDGQSGGAVKQLEGKVVSQLVLFIGLTMAVLVAA